MTDQLDDVVVSLEELQADAIALQTSAQALEELQQVHVSIERFGVGQADIEAATELIERLEISELEGAGVYSLESFPTLTYTAERSAVNLSVAQESIGRAILSGLRTLWRRLMEYLRKAYAWLRALQHNEPKRKRQLLGLTNINRVVWQTITQIEKDMKSPNLAEKEWLVYLESWAKDNPTKLDVLRRAGWLDREVLATLQTYQKKLSKQTEVVAKDATAFLAYLDNPQASALSVSSTAQIKSLYDDYDSWKRLEEPQSVRDWYKNNGEWFTKELPETAADLIPYADLVDHVGVLERTISRVKLVGITDTDVDAVSAYLKQLSEAVVAANTMIADFQEVAKARVAFIGSVYRLLNTRRQLCERHALAMAKADAQREKIRAALRTMDQTVEKLIRNI